MPSLRYLEYALALAEFGSFKRAAIELNISQPAISKGIATMEAEFGEVLFDRSSHPLEPTDSGRLVLVEARRALEAQRNLREKLLSLRGSIRGTLRVAFGPYAGAVFAPVLAKRFTIEVPDVELHLVTRAWDELPRLLRTCEVDLFVGDIGSPALSEEFEIHPIAQEPVAAFFRPDPPLHTHPSPTLADFFAHPMALCRAPLWARDYLRQEMPDYDPRESPAILRVDDYRMIRDIVLHGPFLTFGFRRFFQPDLDSGRLVMRKLPDPPFTQAGVANRKDDSPSPAVRRAIDILLTSEGETPSCFVP